jgi:hypothetical protein
LGEGAAMEPDLRWCADCGRRLDDGADQSVRRCPDCQADADASIAALDDIMRMSRPEFRGAIALRAPLPGWPTAITLLALEVWVAFSELRYVEIPGPEPSGAQAQAAAMTSRLGRRLPKWVVTTDLDTVHRGVGGGGGTPGTDRLLAWHATIAPSLPDRVRVLHVSALAPGATAQTNIDLSTHPMTHRSAIIAHGDTADDADPDCASCGPPPPAPRQAEQTPGIGLDWATPAPHPRSPDACTVPDPRPLCATCRLNAQAVFASKVPTSPQPDRVIALGAQLGSLFGTDLIIPSLVAWPSWFDLTIVGQNSGSWAEGLGAPHRAGRWTAHDDKGRRYRGAATGSGSSVGVVRKDLTFIPGLAADATTLTVTFPSALDGQGRTATFDLRP